MDERVKINTIEAQANETKKTNPPTTSFIHILTLEGGGRPQGLQKAMERGSRSDGGIPLVPLSADEVTLVVFFPLLPHTHPSYIPCSAAFRSKPMGTRSRRGTDWRWAMDGEMCECVWGGWVRMSREG